MNIAIPQIFDQAALQIQRRRRLENNNFFATHSAQNLVNRLQYIKRRFDKILVIGDGTKVFADSFPECQFYADNFEDLPNACQSFDLVISNMHLHLVNDVPGVLCQIHQLLKPGGLFIGAFLGGHTLTELRQAFSLAESIHKNGVSPRVSPFIDLANASSLLVRTGFELPVADRENLNLVYQNVPALMHDLRTAGLTNVLSTRTKAFTPFTLMTRMENIYKQRFARTPEGINASFEFIYLTGWSSRVLTEVK